MKTRISILTCFSILTISQGFSQPIIKDTIAPCIINSTGGSGSYKNFNFEWSIGEVATTETMSDSNILVTHGILQPLPTSRYIGYIDNWWGDDEIRIYPIPTRDWLTVHFYSIEIGKVDMRLYDAGGKILHTKEFYYSGAGRQEKLNLSTYASGTYFLYISLAPNLSTNSIQKYRTYKIQVLR